MVVCLVQPPSSMRMWESEKLLLLVSIQYTAEYALELRSLPSQVGQNAVVSTRRADEVWVLPISVTIDRAKYTGSETVALQLSSIQLLLITTIFLDVPPVKAGHHRHTYRAFDRMDPS